MTTPEFDAELLQLFQDEATERLDDMDAALLAAETGNVPPDTIDALFRNAHTIKGAAGILGFSDMAALAHAAEDILALARSRQVLHPDLVAPLLRATAALRARVGGAAEPFDDLIAELNAGRRRAAGRRARGGAAAEAPAGAPEGDRPCGGRPAAPAPRPRPGQRHTGRSGPRHRCRSQTSSPVLPACQSLAPVPALPSSASPARAAAPPGRSQDAGRRSIRVPAEKIDHLLDLVGEVMQDRRRLAHALGAAEGLPTDAEDELSAGERMLGELKDSAVGMRTLPVSMITGPLPRAVRDLARTIGREVEFTVVGAETELDRVILESLSEPLTHLLRNSVIHGIEPPGEREQAGKPACGRIELRAVPRGGLVEITICDDGRGVSPEIMEAARQEGSLADVLSRAGFSTAGEVIDLAGRGVGLDAVKAHVHSLGGRFDVTSEPGHGMTVSLLLPVALALLKVLLIQRGGAVFGLPIAGVEEVVTVDATTTLQGRVGLDLRGRSLPVVDLAAVIGADAPPLPPKPPALVLTADGRWLAAACDALLGEEEVVVKPLGPLLAGVSGYLGAAILGDGGIALLIEPGALIRGHRRAARGGLSVPAAPPGQRRYPGPSRTVPAWRLRRPWAAPRWPAGPPPARCPPSPPSRRRSWWSRIRSSSGNSSGACSNRQAMTWSPRATAARRWMR